MPVNVTEYCPEHESIFEIHTWNKGDELYFEMWSSDGSMRDFFELNKEDVEALVEIFQEHLEEWVK